MTTLRKRSRAWRLAVLAVLCLPLLPLAGGCSASEMYLTDNTLRRPIDEARRLLGLGARVRLEPGPYPSTPDMADKAMPVLLPPVDKAVFRALEEAGVYTVMRTGQLSPRLQEILQEGGPSLRLDRLPAISGELGADNAVWAEVITYYEKQINDMQRMQTMPKAGSPNEVAQVWRRSHRYELLVGLRLNIADGRQGKVIWKKDLAAGDILEFETDLAWTGNAPPPPQETKPRDADAATAKVARFREGLVTRIAQALVGEMLPRYDYR